MKQKTYRIVTAPDGQHWVPLQPLLNDIIAEYKQAVEQDQPDDVLSRIHVAAQFVDALISEGNRQVYQDEWEDIQNEQTS